MSKIDNLSKSSDTIDSPRPNDKVYDQSILIAGTINLAAGSSSPQSVRARIDNVPIGETRIFHQISDHCLGYRILARLPEPIVAPRLAIIVVTVSGDDENQEKELGAITVQLVPARLQERPYGEVVPPDRTKVLHRENIYGSGPPVEEPFAEAFQLILEHLPARSSVVDVGCGAGAFARGLIGAGHEWLGLELNDRCLELLEQRKLPHRKLTGPNAPFPCADREFDHAICVEVLEHIAEPDPFLREIARVIRGRALFSVPNLEVLPYFHDWEVVPWHLLEASHLNFFTRASLRALLEQHFQHVEVISYGEHPLHTRDGVALDVFLFAVASS
jgi:2-polyprenyl-3-methyl-5-hydroxy-6-metoxy-1,4-benzoquinol methylase